MDTCKGEEAVIQYVMHKNAIFKAVLDHYVQQLVEEVQKCQLRVHVDTSKLSVP